LLYSPDKRRYPVFVVECAADDQRVADGYPTIRWNPIVGAADFKVATRRAEALVKGVDEEDDGPTSSTAGFFERSATDVLAAWLHAAALSRSVEIGDLVEWLGTSTYTVPAAILDQHRDIADPAALTNMRKHLDEKAGRTTSGVERYLTMALSSLASGEGARVSGLLSDVQFDMEQLVRSGGTLYLIAAPDEMATARPFLSLLASELLLAAEQVARSTPEKRLPQTFVAVLDELRYGVRVSNLPYVANTMRKYGVTYVTCSTNSGDEEALYGETAAALLKGAGTSIYGGMDEGSAKDISDRAGQTPVVTASHGGLMGGSESVQHLDALTAADLQRLGAGESVVIRQGLPPVIMFTPSVYEQRGLRRRIKRETAAVAAAVTA
jgi:type IV secretory pathway TraG/TraD family ATPase VirD4